MDKSDQVFTVDKPCTEEEFVNEFNETICSSTKGEFVDEGPDRIVCNDLKRFTDYNTSDILDPHSCQNSCKNPGYGCLACTNPDYFRCKRNKQSVCIHPELQCNHHPDCDNAEDEKFENCEELYIEKLLVKKFATLRCPSRIYPNMETVATVCDDIIECFNGEDEPKSCTNNDVNFYLAISVGWILSIYLGLKSYYKFITKKRRLNESVEEKYEFRLDTIQTSHIDITSLRKQLIDLSLHVKNYHDQNTKVKLGLKIFALEEKYNANEAKVYTSIHNNYLPEIANMVIDAKYPGFVDKHLSYLKRFSDHMNQFENFHYVRQLIGNSLTIVAQYSDNFKDIFILSILLNINGGPGTLLEFPLQFSSIIIISMATTIMFPLLISSVQLALDNPGLMFNSRRKDKWSVRLMCVGVILSSLINPIILKNLHENIQEKIRKYSKTAEQSDKLIQLINKKDEVKKKLSRLMRVDLGLELIYQIALQLILVLLSISKTATTGGLEAFFKVTDSLLLVLMTCWSFKTCILIQRGSIKTEKVFFPFTSQIVILLWSTLASGRRILTIIVFFVPSLGLFSILNHWKAEQLPFTVRFDQVEGKIMTQDDIIILNEMTKNISWSTIDRNLKRDRKHITCPNYTAIYPSTDNILTDFQKLWSRSHG